MKRTVYVDNAATTRVDPRVVEKMLPFFTEYYANPNSVHSPGQQVRALTEQARAQIAACIGARADEIYFTAGGTESDNWVIKELAQRALQKGKKPRIITSAFEHHAVLHAIENSGAAVTLLPVYEDGLVRPADLEAAIGEDTVLVTIMFANNEVGTIQPISELAAVAARHLPTHRRGGHRHSVLFSYARHAGNQQCSGRHGAPDAAGIFLCSVREKRDAP